MALEHNYKILVVSTNFNDLSLENCFWEYSKIRPMGMAGQDAKQSVGLESGVEGLLKVLNSNRTSNEIVKNYSRIVLRDRLDILLSPITNSYQTYTQITPYYADILNIAKRYYDLIFVDLSKKMPSQDSLSILEMSDIVVMNLTQRLKTIRDFIDLRESNPFYQKKNVMLMIGRYDRFSKYNDKNITRYLREKKQITAVPYNTLFFESCSEGTVIDFLVNAKNIKDETDRNVMFVKDIKNISDDIIARLQELQMRI